MLKRFLELWKPVALLAIFVILISLVLEIFVHLEPWQEHWLELIDLAAIAVLAIELLVHYCLAKDKKKFFKENWILIIALLPFGQIVRAVKAIKVMGKTFASWGSKPFHFISNIPKAIRAYRATAATSSKVKEKLKKKKKGK